jgi:hypothetical protein
MWTMFGGGDDEARRHREMAWRRRQRPENEVPRSLAVDAVLVGDDEVAVFISGVRAFTNGVELTVEVRARTVSSGGPGDVLGSVFGHGSSDDRVLLGVELSDGRRCTNLDDSLAFDLDDSGEQPRLMPGGGSGGSRSSSSTLFLSPLPPPGVLRVVCAWPARGLSETITVLSADDILAAAHHARALWPWEPEPEPVWRASPPVVPEGGWFAAEQAQDREP